MLGDPGVDYPEEKAVVDVVAHHRSQVLLSWVQEVGEDELKLTRPRNRAQQSISPEEGEPLELVWRGPDELRALPVAVIGVDSSPERLWRVRATGPAGRGQRRAAVRAPLVLPVQVRRGKSQLDGTLVDISEGGVRCVVDLVPGTRAADDEQPTAPTRQAAAPATGAAGSVALEVGDLVEVTVVLDGDEINCRGEVVRRHKRQDARIEVSIRFLGASERTQDVIRRHVFAILRDMRLRGLI